MVLNSVAARRLVYRASLLVSVGGFLFCVMTDQPAHAHRPGALGVAITMGFLFLSRDQPAGIVDVLNRRAPALLKLLQEPGEASSGPRPIEARVDTIEKALLTTDDARGRDNIPLAIATAVGTLIAGFGDFFASML